MQERLTLEKQIDCSLYFGRHVKQIEDVIVGFEPRALLDAVEVIENVDNNAYDVKIYFRVINIPAEQVELEFMLERLR